MGTKKIRPFLARFCGDPICARQGNVKEEHDRTSQIDALLEAEQAKYGDLIRYNVEDTYGNLHLKARENLLKTGLTRT